MHVISVTDLPPLSCEIVACVVHPQHPSVPVIQYRKFEVRVALPEGNAFPQGAVGGDARSGYQGVRSVFKSSRSFGNRLVGRFGT